jgi:aminodeoxyfutalosine synthase
MAVTTVQPAAPAARATHNRGRRPAARDRRLAAIEARVHENARLSLEDGIAMYETPDVWGVCALAAAVRRRHHGARAYYNVNRHLNYTNVCALSCTFCSFYRKRGQDGAYERTLEEIAAEARAADDAGATELHVVGGLHPWLPFDYYTGMLETIRAAAPRLHVKAFTAVEIVHLARIGGRGRDGYEGIKSVLRDLVAAGLGSLPGGGAEVFDDRVHDEAFKGKIRAGTWLDVHRAAHELGLNTNATILYGHVETREERVRHMLRLRDEQDRAIAAGGGRFQTIIPLPFFPDDSALAHLPGPSGLENLRTLAIARLLLDNFAHVKAFWIMQTLAMAQIMLQSGADDVDGTVVWYDITKVGGATTHQETSVADLRRAIRGAGCIPVERDTLYREVVRDGSAWRAVE